MNKDDLHKIIEEYPVALADKIRKPIYENNIIVGEEYIRGLIREFPWVKGVDDTVLEEYGLHRYGIRLSLECDNLGETLVHEAVHIKYPWMKECNVEFLGLVYWDKYPSIRKSAQRRVVEELEKKGL